jgi:hypothetical protein
VVNVLAISSLGGHIGVNVDLAAHGNLGELSLDIKGEGTEFADVNGSSGTELVIHVLDEGSPDNEALMTCNGKIY